MENNILSLILQIRDRIRHEESNYVKAIEAGHSEEAKEIAERITHLKAELETIQPQKRGYNGL